jgi:CheY-like chemotaxis protein
MTLKVLVVDDEAPIRKLIRLNLERDGFSVVEASDGCDALMRLDETVSLLVSDLSMPGLDGVELVAEALRRRPDLPVLFMSAYEEEYAGRLDGHCCFRKPFDPRELVQHIRRVLANEDHGYLNRTQ